MIKSFFCSIIFFLIINGCNSSTSDKNFNIVEKKEIVKRDTAFRFFTKSFITKNKNTEIVYFYAKCFLSISDSSEFALRVNKFLEGEECDALASISKQEGDVLLFNLDSVLYSKNQITFIEFNKKFNLWQKDDRFLLAFTENMKSISDDFFIEDVLYNYSATKVFFNDYVDSRHQYWGSVTANDFCKILAKVNRWLNYSSKKERINFYKYLNKYSIKFLSNKKNIK
jgi:hypothetical protein